MYIYIYNVKIYVYIYITYIYVCIYIHKLMQNWFKKGNRVRKLKASLMDIFLIFCQTRCLFSMIKDEKANDNLDVLRKWQFRNQQSVNFFEHCTTFNLFLFVIKILHNFLLVCTKANYVSQDSTANLAIAFAILQ